MTSPQNEQNLYREQSKYHADNTEIVVIDDDNGSESDDSIFELPVINPAVDICEIDLCSDSEDNNNMKNIDTEQILHKPAVQDLKLVDNNITILKSQDFQQPTHTDNTGSSLITAPKPSDKDLELIAEKEKEYLQPSPMKGSPGNKGAKRVSKASMRSKMLNQMVDDIKLNIHTTSSASFKEPWPGPDFKASLPTSQTYNYGANYTATKPASQVSDVVGIANMSQSRDPRVPASWTEEMRKFYLDPIPQNKTLTLASVLMKMKDSGPWYLHKDDRKRNTAWYHFSCSNCHKDGHRANHCLEPKRRDGANKNVCSMCGEEGHHMQKCPHRKCLTCFRNHPCFTEQCRRCANEPMKICTRCNIVGHKEKDCPDSWRMYHSTVVPGPVKQPSCDVNKDLRNQWCCNCAKKGHLYENCKEQRFSRAPLVPSLVASYEEINLDGISFSETPTASVTSRDMAQSQQGFSLQDYSSVALPIEVNSNQINKSEQPQPIKNHERVGRYICRPFTLTNKREKLSMILWKAFLTLDNYRKDDVKELTDCWKYIFQHKCTNLNKRTGFKGNPRALQAAQKLSLAMVGKYGVNNGKYHVSCLRQLARQLSQMKSISIPDQMFSQVQFHYNVIFAGHYSVNDFFMLAEEFFTMFPNNKLTLALKKTKQFHCKVGN